MRNSSIKSENASLKKENQRLRELCNEKDRYFKQLMSEALRCGSNLASKHMKERKDYLNGK